MMRCAWRALFGGGAVLMVLAILAAPAAFGATPAWEFDTPSFNFGPKPYGSGPTEPHEFVLTNTGETQLVAKTWGISWSSVAAWLEDGPPFHVTSSDCRNRTLEPAESCFVAVAFDPLHEGGWAGAVMVKSQAGEVPIASVHLSGEGTGPSIPVKPDRLLFESVAVGTTSAPQTITLEEQSSFGYQIDDVYFGPFPGQGASSGPFRIVGETCQGMRLDPGTTCTVEIVMSPTETGVFNSELEISDFAPESPQTVEIEGTATPAPPTVGRAPAPSAGTVAATPPPAPRTSPAPARRTCPKGKRKIAKKGRRICVKTHKRHRHPRRSAKH